MVRFTILALCLLGTTNAFSSPPIAKSASSGSALFSYHAFRYQDKDAISMDQPGVLPTKKVTPIKTRPSSVSKITIQKTSDDQHDANFHAVSTVPSAMSRIERGSANDDQHDANFHKIQTVPSEVSKIRRAPTTVSKKAPRPSSYTTNYRKPSTCFSNTRGQHDAYFD